MWLRMAEEVMSMFIYFACTFIWIMFRLVTAKTRAYFIKTRICMAGEVIYIFYIYVFGLYFIS